jgi:hypothetical protein
MKLGEVGHDLRGFELIEFRDRYDVPCSLQMSSLADYEQPGISAVWLGPDDAAPKVLASKAARLGVETTETTGWVPYPVPREVLLTTRAHLGRGQVQALIDHLQAWLKTGSFEIVENVAKA